MRMPPCRARTRMRSTLYIIFVFYKKEVFFLERGLELPRDNRGTKLTYQRQLLAGPSQKRWHLKREVGDKREGDRLQITRVVLNREFGPAHADDPAERIGEHVFEWLFCWLVSKAC